VRIGKLIVTDHRGEKKRKRERRERRVKDREREMGLD
jgi:hypothetical protein